MTYELVAMTHLWRQSKSLEMQNVWYIWYGQFLEL